MKRLLIAGVVAVGFFGVPARAADMPLKALPPPPPTAYTWTGFYIGVHAGGAWVSQNDSFFQSPVGFAVFDPVSLRTGTGLGFAGGFQGGYNWQFAPAWVLGVEGDLSSISQGNNATVSTLTSGGVPQAGHGLGMNSNLDWLSSARGRMSLTMLSGTLRAAPHGAK